MNLYNLSRLLLQLILLVSCGTLISSRSIQTPDINSKLIQTLKSFMNPKENPCEKFFHYACGNWETANDDHLMVLDNINSLDYTFNRKISQILQDRIESHPMETDEIYDKVRDYYETCEHREFVNVTKYLDVIKPMDGEEWPLASESWSPKSEWTIWTTLGRLAAVGFNGLFFDLETHQHNATGRHITVDQYQSVNSEYSKAYSMKWSEDKNESMLATSIVDFMIKLRALHYDHDKEVMDSELEQISLNDLQQQVKDIDFFAYFSGFLGKEDLAEVQIKVANITYLQQLAELVKSTPRDILIHSLRLSFLSYLEDQTPGYKWHDGCVSQMRKLFPLALNYLYEREVYQFQRNSTDPIIQMVYRKMQQTFAEILQEHNDELSPQELEFLMQKILKMKLNIGNLPQGVEEDFYADYLHHWKVVKGDYYRTHLSAMRHRATQDFGRVKLQAASPLNTFLVLNGGSPYYSPNKNLLVIPFAYLSYPTFERGFNDLFLFAELGNTVGHEIMHGFDTSGIEVDADGNPSKLFDITHKPKYSHALECMRKTKTFSLDEKLADFGGFRLAYDTYFQQSNISEFAEGESVLTSKQLFFIKFAQFFCAVDESRITYDTSHDTPFRRVPEVVANYPEFEEVFSCPLKTGEDFVEKCMLW